LFAVFEGSFDTATPQIVCTNCSKQGWFPEM
jgi:hypothetical protein